MRFTPVLLAGLASLVSVASAGTATVTNRCPFPVYLWSVGSSVSPKITLNKLPANGVPATYSEVTHSDPKTGGIAIKITKEDNGLYTGAPELVFAYSKTDRLWYDISQVFGNANTYGRIILQSGNGNCPAVVWYEGSTPHPINRAPCDVNADIHLTLCVEYAFGS